MNRHDARFNDSDTPIPDSDSQRNPECRRFSEKQNFQNSNLSLEDIAALSLETIQQKFHESNVYQIELEAQNEELRQIQTELEESRARYFDLYDLAPIGYCTLNEDGFILESNLTAANLLGSGRSLLINSPFNRFVCKDDQDVFYCTHRQLSETGKATYCELKMVRHDKETLWVRLFISLHRDRKNANVIHVAVIDISQQKQAESELSARSQFYHSVLDSLTEHVAVLDKNGVIISVNNAWRQFGLENDATANEIDPIGQNYIAHCERAAIAPNGEDAKTMAKAMQAVLDGKLKTFQLDYSCHSPSKKRWFRVTINPIQGSLPGLVVSHLNISEQKLTEEELRISEHRQELALSGAGLGLWDWHLPSHMATFDKRWCEMLGYQVNEIGHNRQTFHSLLHEEDTPAVEALRTAHLNGSTEVYEAEFRMRHKSGEWIWILARGKVVERDGEGNPVRMSGTHMNLTERKLAEQKIKKSERFLRTVADAIPGMVSHWTKTLHCDFANAKYQTYFAGHQRQILGETIENVLGEELYRKNEPFIRAVLEGVSQQFERVRTQPDGTSYDSWTHYVPDIVDGHVDGFFVLITDITLLKNIERQLLLSLKEKEALLSEVHHRVKNNLQVIISLLRLESARSKQADTKSVLFEMQGRIRSMALLHELLYRSGTFAAVDLSIYLTQLANHAFRVHSPQSGYVQLQLDLTPVHVVMDQAIACGMLVNELISNCLKHGFPDDRKGVVRIELQPVAGDSYFCLSVSDNGVGLPDDFVTKREETLGIDLVADLANQLGGTLELDCGPTTVFSVTFKIDRSLQK